MKQLILITPEQKHERELSLIPEFFRSGLSVLHIRKPFFKYEEMQDYIAAIPSNYHPRLVIHSHYELNSFFRLKGIHLPEKVRKERVSGIRMPYAKARIISTALHNLNELQYLAPDYQYVFISPVFKSISKTTYPAAFKWEELNEALQTYKQQQGEKPQCIALGGIDEYTLPLIKKSAFDGAALLGAVWQHPEPLQQFLKLLTISC